MNDPRPPIFRLMTEIGIIQQLSTAALARRLPDGLHPTQFNVLSHMMRQPAPERPADLARAFQVPKASMTNTLMQLEKRGLIRAAPNPEDARSKVMSITDAGRALFLEVIEDVSPVLMKVTQDIDGLEGVLPVLEALREAFDSNRDP